MVILESITAIGYILWPFGNLVVIWYIFPRFGILHPEKSGNPGWDPLLMKHKEKLSPAKLFS
jgi:hypothetical protein